MADILRRILDVKRAEVAAAKRARPQSALEQQTFPPVRDFVGALRAKNPAVIAEIKPAERPWRGWRA